MAYEELADIFALLPGASQSSGKVYTWTSKPAEPRYSIEEMSLSLGPDGYILINAVTGRPFDIKVFLAELGGSE